METVGIESYLKLASRVKELENTVQHLQGLAKAPTVWEAIDSNVAGVGGAASFDFQNISPNYNKLVVDLHIRCTTALTAVAVNIRFNNDAGATIYKYTLAIQNSTPAWSTAASAGTNSIYFFTCCGSTAPTGFDVGTIEVPGYSNSNAYKGCFSRYVNRQTTLASGLYIGSCSGWYDSNTPINRVTIFPSTGNFAQYSTARLYGVL